MALRTMKSVGLSEVMKFAQKVEGKGMRTAKGNNGGSRLGRTGNMGSSHSSILPCQRGVSIHTSHWPIPPNLRPTHLHIG